MAQNRRVNPKTFFGELMQCDLYKVAFSYVAAAWIGDAISKKKLTRSCGQLALL
jgi:hypothetical protein